MTHPIEAFAARLQTTLAQTTETMGLGGRWPESLPIAAIIALMLVTLAALSVAIIAAIPIVLVLMERKVSAYFQKKKRGKKNRDKEMTKKKQKNI